MSTAPFSKAFSVTGSSGGARSAPSLHRNAAGGGFDLHLRIEDRDVLVELERYAEGRERDAFALEALKIGVLALRRASSSVDADLIQRETSRLLETLRMQMDEHASSSHLRMTTSLKEYFDPESGRFSQRVKLLTAEDGELSRLLRSLLDGDESRLAKTLLQHVGEHSPLMKQLSPDQSQGLLATLREIVGSQLMLQRERLMKEFSLDNDQGSLARLVKELTSRHGDLSKDLQEKIDVVVKEFSLDQENSALSRLVQNVDRAQRTITSEFSLDNEQSALRRLKTELASVLEQQAKINASFQEEVKLSLTRLAARREEQLRSTRHGADFQQAVFEFLAHDAQRRGDMVEDTGDTPGLIPRCKVGDAVIALGADHAASGARIVVEVKQDAAYTLPRAQAEMETARKNRNAQLGLFVFSQRSAPPHIPKFARHGADLYVVWDAEDATTDAYLQAALESMRALAVRVRRTSEQECVDFAVIDRALIEIEKRVENLEEIRKSAETIKNSSGKILDRVRTDRESLDRQLEALRDALQNVKRRFDEGAAKLDAP